MIKIASVARGDIPADLVIHNAKIANVYTLEYELADVAVCSGKIAGIAQHYDGVINFDAEGKVLIPGMIDGHVHIEDTMMTPQAFAEAVAVRGTTAVMADPHEISNALGISGLEYMFRASQGLPIDIFYGAPSCVPASDFETPFEALDMTTIKSMFDRNLTQHLGEMMNFPAVINGDAEAWGKILAVGNVPLTGHAPNVSGKNLNAYLSSGISSDHECNEISEAREKLKRGMWIMIREGASFPNLKNLLPLIKENPLNASRCMAVSDDITARYLIEKGHMDEKIRIMINDGLNPFTALRMVTLSPAEYFRLYDRGGIAPGKIADFSLLYSDVIDENFKVQYVWKNGRQTVRDGEVYDVNDSETTKYIAPVTKITVKKIPSLEQLKIKYQPDKNINVIGINHGSILTKTLQLKPKIENGFIVPDIENDIAKIVVLERHKDTGAFGTGFVKGFGIKKGAVGSSVAHDAHNFVVIGADDESIMTALKSLAKIGGGLTVCEGENILHEFSLPIGGLMSYLNPYEVCAELEKTENAAVKIGVETPHPFMVMSFLCLTVIPELRITDQGYIDITEGGVQSIFAI